MFHFHLAFNVSFAIVYSEHR